MYFIFLNTKSENSTNKENSSNKEDILKIFAI